MKLSFYRSLLLAGLILLPGVTSYSQVTFTSSNLPIIVINTNGQTILDDPKIEADMGIIHNAPGIRNNLTDPYNNFNGKIGIEIRGSSSQMFPKKQYGIELRDALGNGTEASLLDMPAEEDWVLFAPYNDKALMRDVLAYKLSRDQGRYAPRTRYCEVVLNGEYMGVYVLIEKIKRDKNRVDINKLDPDEITGGSLTGGYIIKIDKATGNPGEGWNSTYPPDNREGDQAITFWYEVPKAEDIVVEQKHYIQQYINDFESTLAGPSFKDPVNGYAKYIDVRSFVDYFILNEISKNVDGYRLSTFFYKKRDADGGKLHMGPVWDYNLGFGNADYCTTGSTDGFVLNFNEVCPADWWLIPFWWNRLNQDSTYRAHIHDRWTELREGPYQVSTIHAYIDSVSTVLNMEAQQRNFQRWPVLGQYVWPNYYVGPTFQSEVDWLKQWVTDRIAWLDVYINGMITSTEEMPSDFISLAAYPNPFQNELTIDYQTVTPGRVTITVMDATGKAKLVRSKDHAMAGLFKETCSLSELAPGMYILKMQLGSRPPIIRKLLKH